MRRRSCGAGQHVARPSFLPRDAPAVQSSSGGYVVDVQEPQQEPPTTTVLMMASQLTPSQWNEWSNIRSLLTPERYFQQRSDAWEQAPMPGNTGSSAIISEESVHLKTESKTRIPGKNSVLFDVGSNINIIGRSTEEEFSANSTGAGLETKRCRWLWSRPTSRSWC